MLLYYNVKEACENASDHFTLPPIITTNVRCSILLSVVTWFAIYVVVGTLFKSKNVLCTYHHPPPPTMLSSWLLLSYSMWVSTVKDCFKLFGFILFIVFFYRMASVTSNRGIRKWWFVMSKVSAFIFLVFSLILTIYRCLQCNDNINSQLDATIKHFIHNYNQLNTFLAIISPILRSTRPCLQLVV